MTCSLFNIETMVFYDRGFSAALQRNVGAPLFGSNMFVKCFMPHQQYSKVVLIPVFISSVIVL